MFADFFLSGIHELVLIFLTSSFLYNLHEMRSFISIALVYLR